MGRKKYQSQFVLAHIGGTLGHPEVLPGLSGTVQKSDQCEKQPNEYEYLFANPKNRGNATCQFKVTEENREWYELIFLSARAAGDACRLAGRLFLPENSFRNKCPWHREATANPDRVILSPNLEKAAQFPSLSIAHTDGYLRKKPVFRTAAPGLKTVFAVNMLLIWVLLTSNPF